MGKRRSSWPSGAAPTVFLVIVLASLATSGEWVAFGLWLVFGVALLITYRIWFVKKTTCDAPNASNARLCSNSVQGRIRVCHEGGHQEYRWSKFLALFGVGPIASWIRAGRRTTPPFPMTARSSPPPERNAQPVLSSAKGSDRLTMACTLISTATGIVAMIAAILALL